MQKRALATREKLLTAAVELFGTVGYGSTGLNDIADRAGIARGLLHYHFPTKESVAVAIMDAAEVEAEKLIGPVRASSAPTLEKIITISFIVMDLTTHHPLVRVSSLLKQSLNQVSGSAHTYYDEARPAVVVGWVQQAIADGDLRDGCDPLAFGHASVIGIYGTRLLADGTGWDPFTLLDRMWRVMLAGHLTDRATPVYAELLAELSHRYTAERERPGYGVGGEDG